MSVRIWTAVAMLLFFYPYTMEIAKLDLDGIWKLYGVLGYFVLMNYLIITGNNLKSTGKPW